MWTNIKYCQRPDHSHANSIMFHYACWRCFSLNWLYFAVVSFLRIESNFCHDPMTSWPHDWLVTVGPVGHFLGPKMCLELELPPWSVLNWNAAAMSSRRAYSETNEPGWKPAKVIPVLSRFSGWSMQKTHWLIACTVIISAILGSTNPEPLSGKVGRGFGSANWDSRTRCRILHCNSRFSNWD